MSKRFEGQSLPFKGAKPCPDHEGKFINAWSGPLRCECQHASDERWCYLMWRKAKRDVDNRVAPSLPEVEYFMDWYRQLTSEAVEAALEDVKKAKAKARERERVRKIAVHKAQKARPKGRSWSQRGYDLDVIDTHLQNHHPNLKAIEMAMKRYELITAAQQ